MTEYKRVFLDTTPIIYLIDEDMNYGDKTKSIINTLYNNSSKFITSTITFEEYLVFPYKTNNTLKITAFNNFISLCDVSVFDIDKKIADKAAQIRAEYKDFKSMDALQLAAAVISGCDVFFTNDKQLRQFKEISVLTLDDYRI